jgi:hypothetical protein
MTEYPYVWEKTVQAGPMPAKPSIAEVDKVMRCVSQVTGETWRATKLGGYWRLVREDGHGWGAVEGERTRDFFRAVADGTGVAIVRDID